ncbi:MULTISPECIES: hypothetical protein [Streptomyces]|uniref:Phage baseplate protein n=1 Tax=Streptomyces albus (strain ATCC 21838 / DSM 41398 / FERM P-419 / JCM 4703 / NBRC 107858) TaxID=1081613 RepID=A0A0B5F473_STRA4|nr:hypothetical protein [Streptomyces sp. SCSIO ZS0520]AJE85102.1 hypothetical protein SLNWT_4726 [Streptomyces albus]AOU79409.1 hypothetical protein SLNHY_4718 [Streptomyces albus]AYN35136.1 hypothetical protein DUI70_4638 [Streptomyces albus]
MTWTGPAELLAAWEAGVAVLPHARARLLHQVARPGADEGTLAALPVGTREADLLALRRALFGERMQVRLECGACGEAMEFDLDAGAFAGRLTAPADGPGEPGRDGGDPLRLTVDGWEVAFRPPTVADLTAAAQAGPEARRVLLERCVHSAVREGRPARPHELPASVQRAIAEAAEEADPGADITLAIACPECGSSTRAALDIASYLWTELDAWAREVLLDVHLLATAYGWSEPEILALSPLRRRYYLELCADA